MEVVVPRPVHKDRAHRKDRAHLGVLSLGALALFGLVGSALTSTGCNTKAVGINECREVEAARCRASVACGVIEKDEVEACERFYEDHCLHGMSGDQVPSADEHKTCLELIESAGQTAQESLGMGGTGEPDETACKIIDAPWKRPECAYLVEKEEESMGGSDSE